MKRNDSPLFDDTAHALDVLWSGITYDTDLMLAYEEYFRSAAENELERGGKGGYLGLSLIHI